MAPSPPPFSSQRPLGQGASSRVSVVRLEADWGGLPKETPLALKRPHDPGDPRARQAFTNESDALAQIHSPHVVQLVESGEDDQGVWLLQNLVPGPTLRELLRGGPLHEGDARRLGRDLADGLAALHTSEWLHGDLKLDNARLDADGRAVWLDLGLAQGPNSEPRAAGNLAYLSPEEARGHPRTQASEVFSLGLILFELATGVPALAGLAHDASRDSGVSDQAQRDSVLFALADPRFPLASELRPALSPFLDQLLAELLDLDPRKRPTMATVREALATGEEGWWWYERQRRGARTSAGSPSWPFVGRDAERLRLEGFYETAARKGGGVVWIEGETGVGKTRLVREAVPALRLRLAGSAPIFLSSSCSAWEVERPGQPIRSLLRQWLGLPRGRGVGVEERERLEQLVSPAVARTLEESLAPRSEEATEIAVPAALAEWLLALADRRPWIVALDDFRSAGEVTLDIVDRVAQGLEERGCLLILLARIHGLARHPQSQERCREKFQGPGGEKPAPLLRLAPLAEPAIGELVEHLFTSDSPRNRLQRVLYERSEGNPGQFEELLRTLIHRQQVTSERPEGPYEFRGLPDAIPKPRSLANAIASSYRALPPDERTWLARMAVAGATLDPDLLEHAFASEQRHEVEAVLANFLRSGWLVTAGRRYRFARQALRDGILRTLRPEERRELHGLAADALGELEGDSLQLSKAYQRAYHLRQADRATELLEFLPELVRLALERGHPQRVHRLCSWGLDALDQAAKDESQDKTSLQRQSTMRIELLEAAADSADRLGRRAEQRAWLDRLSDLDLDPDQQPIGVGRVYLLHARHAAATGRYGLARGLFLNAGQLFQRAGAADLESETWRRMAHVQSHLGELEHAAELSRRAFRVGRSPSEKALAAVARGLIELLEDRYESALRHVDRARNLVRGMAGVRELGPLAAASLMRARIYRVAGRPGRALAAVQHAARLASRAGERRLEIEAWARMGVLWIDVTREEEAESRLRDALFSAREIEDGRSEALASLWLGTLLCENERPEGRRLIARSAELADQLGHGRLATVCSALQARVGLSMSDPERALEDSEDAMSGLQRFGAELPDRIVIMATHALCLRANGFAEEAREADHELSRTIRYTNARIANTNLRHEHAEAARRGFVAASTVAGPLMPRSLSDTGIFEQREPE